MGHEQRPLEGESPEREAVEKLKAGEPLVTLSLEGITIKALRNHLWTQAMRAKLSISTRRVGAYLLVERKEVHA